jgi:hypothetical protein
MARELEEVDEPAALLNTPEPNAVAPTSEYQSSEELQRRNRDVFADKTAKANQQKDQTEKAKVRNVLDKYIAKHSKTSEVRKMAKEDGRTADAQLDLSAEVVVILEKIKNELR